MKAAIASLGSVSSDWLYQALKEYFDEVDHLDLHEFDASFGDAKVWYGEKELPKYDCIYLRGSYRYANLLGALTTILGKHTYIPIDCESYRLGHDKIFTHLRLQEHNIPQPITYLVSTAGAAKKLLKQVTYPIMMKIPGGTHGKGVMFADSPESAKTIIDVLTILQQPFMVQEYIETNGKDIRALVVGDKVVAAMQRIAPSAEKRANIHAGGTAEKIMLEPAQAKIAIAAAQACKCEICGVDLLPSGKGPLVLEVNLSPGLQGITRVTKINIAQKIAQHLFERANKWREQKGKAVVKQELGTEHEIHTSLDFRGNRILLPEIATLGTKFNEQSEVKLKVKKGRVSLEDIE